MSVRRLVSVFDAPAVARVTSNTINLASPVVDVQSLIQKFEAWVPLAVPVAEIHPSTRPHFQAPTEFVTQPALAPAVATVAEIRPSTRLHFQAPAKYAPQFAPAPAVDPVAQSKSETAKVPSVGIFEASELHKNSSLTARTAETEAETPETPQVLSVQIFNAFKLHKNPNPLSVAPVAKAKPKAPQLPSVQIVNVPEQHQNPPIRAPAVQPKPEAAPQVPFAQIFEALELHKNPSVTAPAVEPKPAAAPQVPFAEIIQDREQPKTPLIMAPAVSATTRATPTLLSTRAPAPQQFQPRPSVRQGVTSRLFSYETDPKFLKRRAEAKLRRVAAAAKSSLSTWAH